MDELNIVEWTKAFAKYKDSVKRQIESIQNVSENMLIVKLKDGHEEKYLCESNLKEYEIASFEYDKIVCLNTKSNLEWLIENWDKIKDKKTTFIFVNLKRSESWLINPRMHHGITDKVALKPGLKTLFETVPEVF